MKVGDKFRIGGKLGCVMTVFAINGTDVIFKDDSGHCTFYYSPGDCALVPYRDFEQLSLFDL